jgi:LmbE family N-acetylglucosaminyl deacetylase
MLLETITCWIGSVEPQLILTFGPEGVSGHPDHVIISKVVTQAYDQCCQKGLLLYIRPSEATVLGCSVSSSIREDGQPQIEIDISDFKLDKVRAIQSHASQNTGLPGRPEEDMDKIPCHELFSIARGTKTTENYPDWFETVRKKEMSAVHEQA